MKNGLYHVDFRANNTSFGQGIVVIKDGAANGGDHAFLFTGPVSGPDNALTSRIAVQKWNPAGNSIFPGVNRYDLDAGRGGNRSGPRLSWARG